MGENGIVLLFTSHGTGLAPKTWKKLSSVQNEAPYVCPLPFEVGRAPVGQRPIPLAGTFRKQITVTKQATTEPKEGPQRITEYFSAWSEPPQM